MTEADFFLDLEYRLCGEFAAVPPAEAPGLWCDGIIPTRWQLDASPLIISGDAWVGGLPGHNSSSYQEKWGFILKLYDQASGDSIAWDCLLPPDDVTGWVVVDRLRRCLAIALPATTDPGAQP